MPRASGRSNEKRLFDHAREVRHFGHQIMMFRDPATNLDDRRLLKSIGTDCFDRHLCRDRDHRHTVELGVGNSSHQIGRSGTTGRHANADFTGRARDALCCKTAALFVAR